MGVIKSSSSYILKLFINHFVSGIYSLVLFIVFTIAFEGKYQFLGSVVAIMFYLFLVYSFMWEAGAKRGVSLNSDKIKFTDGILIMSAGSGLFYLTTVMSFVLSFFASNSTFAERTVDVLYRTFFYINVFFSQCMYSGLFAQLFGDIPSVPAICYLISLLPGLLIAAFAYNFGSKNFRLRTILGIKYNEEKEKIKNNY